MIFYQKLKKWVLNQPLPLWAIAVMMSIGIALILSADFIATARLEMVDGEPSPMLVKAPRQISYISNVLTEQARDSAEARVPDVYTDIDLNIGRNRVQLTEDLFAFIKNVRSDSLATTEWKITALTQIDAIATTPEIATLLVNMTEVALSSAEGSARGITNELMSRQIKESGNAISSNVRAMLGVSMPDNQVKLLMAIVPQLVVPNSFLDPVTTSKEKELARQNASPVTQEFFKDDLILREGELVTPFKLEALEKLGLQQQEIDWWEIGRNCMAATVSVVILFLYFNRFRERDWLQRRYPVLLALLILVFLFLGKWAIGLGNYLPYLYPISGVAILIGVIYDIRLAILVSTMLAGLLGYTAPNSLEYAIYAYTGSVISLLTVRRHRIQRISALFRAGLFAVLGNFAMLLIFKLNAQLEPIEALRWAGIAMANGVLSASVAILGFYVVGNFLGIVTMLQLQELATAYDQPVLQQLLRTAPGTYHHSHMVAVLAEHAAERIGANSLLVRVGAFYHDIGKMQNAIYFTENQDGTNLHDTLDPYKSAEIIIGHVTGGLELARQHGLPNRIQDFIAEHHGNQLLKFFYKKACDQNKDKDEVIYVVNEELFRYPGPRPRSRETAIVMMADSVEATSKAVQPNNLVAIEKLVRKITDELLTSEQLDDSGLSLKDVHIIREAFIETLQGLFHVRVKYAGNEELVAANARPIETEMRTIDRVPLPVSRSVPVPKEL